jgi:hypothetical protein
MSSDYRPICINPAFRFHGEMYLMLYLEQVTLFYKYGTYVRTN